MFLSLLLLLLLWLLFLLLLLLLLLWNAFLLSMSKRICKTLGVISKIKNKLNKPTLIDLYYSLIFPHIIYCNVIWGNSPDIHLKQLTKCQNRFIRIFKNLHPHCHTSEYYLEMKILNIKNLFIYHGRCQRTNPPCKYLHPPQHLKEQLLQNGRNNLIRRNLQLNAAAACFLPAMYPMFISPSEILFDVQMVCMELAADVWLRFDLEIDLEIKGHHRRSSSFTSTNVMLLENLIPLDI
ncbi:hypothetical protein HELRODRAFT_179602 [Helobdella robusta]|uniref:Muscleblind-like CCCH zinc finger domain-containing protein n=1 Tax=Helobdella robusta TaxID=6412 RepID=T1FEX6_HELRO|nr:hypothetical protein HELRODRAFT_179602 [Helobdella robusta]ESN95263.1 hypothetical protein HELRODRAFT_179602 [Helobdella robusta]